MNSPQASSVGSMAEPRARVLTIDGPGASGKGTLARLLAERLGWSWLESGLAYRGLAWLAEREGGAQGLDDEESLVRLTSRLHFELHERRWHLYVDDRDLTSLLAAEGLADLASRVSVHPAVRARLLPLQRSCLQLPGLIAEGRDMGTVVFPAAVLKVFLTASAEIRAERRWRQLSNQGIRANLNELTEAIRARDRRDCERETSPLRPAEGAIVLDSTERSVSELAAQILERLGDALGRKA